MNLKELLFVISMVVWAFNVDGAVHRKSEICLQPTESGRCFGYIPNYAYNAVERKCEEFIYGGCGGNGNRFVTKEECEYTCRNI